MNNKMNSTNENPIATTTNKIPLKYSELKQNLLTSLSCTKGDSNSLNMLFNYNQEQLGYIRLNLN